MSKSKDNTTENKILNAAKDIFQEKGMDGARMQEIADKANINKSMLHYYYRSKQVLFEAVFSSAFALLAPQLNTILNDESSIEDKIRNFTHNYITFISKHPYLPSFIIHELNRNPEFILKMKDQKGFPTIEKFNKQVDKEVKLGTLKPISGEQLFINILSMCILPFVASSLLMAFTKASKKEYKQLMTERKTAVADFIISAIKK